MSAVLVTTALVVALLSVPSIAGITAMGLAGGDGEAPSPFFGILAAIVGFGSLVGVSMQLALGIPAAVLLASDAVSL